MARLPMESLKYFSFDVDFFSDRKIKRLKNKYRSDGICILLYSYTSIYRKSYYTDFDDDFIIDISEEFNIKGNRVREILNFIIGLGLLIVLPKIGSESDFADEMSEKLELSEDLTKRIINFLSSRSMFKLNKLTAQDKVITSASVQRRYQEGFRGIGSKRAVFVEADYWILEKSETLGFIKVRSNENKSEKKSDKSENNSNKSTIEATEEIKVNESKLNYMSVDGVSVQNLTQEEYNALVDMSSRSVVDAYIRKIIGWQKKTGKTLNSPFNSISEWIVKDGHSRIGKKLSYDLDKWEETARNLDLYALGFEEEEHES